MQPSRFWGHYCRGLVVILVLCAETGAADPESGAAPAIAAEPSLGGLRVGGYVQNIDPREYPVPVNGGFVQRMADRVIDPLAARTLVIARGEQAMSLTIVDSCLLPRDLVDAAKRLAARRTGMPTSRMLVAATHAHSVPAVQGIHGSEASPTYRAQLTEQIAESIAMAHARLRPAEVGWASRPLHRFVYCRRWLMAPGTATTIPFTGRETNQVQMNPGHQNANRIRPVGPVDPEVVVLAFRDPETHAPLAVLGNWNTHYAGAPNLSSDYFGHFCRKIGGQLGELGELGEVDGDFVALMSNGTSGDANCIDFSQSEPTRFDAAEVADAVMEKAVAAYRSIVTWHSDLPLRMEQTELTLGVRMPDAEEVEKAREVTASWIEDRLPENMREVYARETILLSEMPPTRKVLLQTFALGEFAITASPCEVYGSTGLHLKSHSPFARTMHIGWANDYLGYLPPPEHFAFGGYTTWRARSSCLEETAEPKIRTRLLEMLEQLHEASPVGGETDSDSQATGKAEAAKPEPGDSEPADADRADAAGKAAAGRAGEESRGTPLSPRTALTRFSVPTGYRLELAACEPQVIDPVQIAFDSAGRMWVVEMRDYPTGPPAGSSPRGRIRILDDRDEDGFYEQSRTFADGIDFPTGVLPWRDGVVVTMAGRVVWMRDDNGDGRCDREVTWFTGFAEDNEQLRANHPTWTLRQRLHIANGLRGGQIVPQSPPGKNGSDDSKPEPLELRGRDFEFDPFGGQFAAVAGNSQFGFFEDDVGRQYICSNRNPCRMLMGPLDAVAGNPLLPPEQWVVDVIPAAEQSRVRGLVDAWTTSNLHAGQFTAACGIFRYQSGLLTDLQNDFLVCEPTASVVCRYRTARDGIVPSVQRDASPIEFIASTDAWFRPVDITDGPDGAVYVVDMHRAIIEHPQWVPDDWKTAIDQRRGDQAGRIYRLVPASQPTALNRAVGSAATHALDDAPVSTPSQCAALPFNAATDEALVASLDHPHRWHRITASRLLAERAHAGDLNYREDIAMQLRDACLVRSGSARSVLAGLWLLQGLEHLHASDVMLALGSPHPVVRVAGIKLCAAHEREGRAAHEGEGRAVHDSEGRVWALAWKRCGELFGEPAERVRYHALLHMEPTAAQLAEALTMPTSGPEADRWIGAAVSRSSLSLFSEVFDRVLSSPGAYARLEAWVERAGWAGDEACFAELNRPGAQVSRTRLKAAYVRGAWRGGRSVSVRKTNWSLEQHGGWESARRWAADMLRDERQAATRGEASLYEAAQYLALAESDELTRETSWELLASGPDEWLPTAAARWAQSTSPESARDVLEGLAELAPRASQLVIAEMIRSPRLAPVLIDGLLREAVDVRWIPPAEWKSLLKQADATQRARLGEQRRPSEAADRIALVQDYLRSMETIEDAPNAMAGQALFQQHCASCHRVDGVGVDVGPTISDLRTQTSSQIVMSILHPGAVIDADYLGYRLLTTDGRVLTGRLLGADDITVTLGLANGVRETVAREDVEVLEQTGKSVMPEGFEAQLTPAQLRDLVHYLKTWRLASLR